MASVFKSLSRDHVKKSGKRDGGDDDNKPQHRQRILILSSRGVTHRHRHLLNDLHSLLPHSRKDAKLDTKTKLYQLNELADLYNCNNVLFFEARKAKDLYLWMSKAPNGPTVKLHVQNIHTMFELHFPGNCLRGSRPVLSFDATFDTQPHLLVIKELLIHVFGVPPRARKSKPFIDHVMGFTIVDGKIWIRCFEIKEEEASKTTTTITTQQTEEMLAEDAGGDHKVSLVEIGPRFVLTPIVILEGSFGGPVIYENKEFVSPNQIRSDLRRARQAGFASRAEQGVRQRVKARELGLQTGEPRRRREFDELDDATLFA